MFGIARQFFCNVMAITSIVACASFVFEFSGAASTIASAAPLMRSAGNSNALDFRAAIQLTQSKTEEEKQEYSNIDEAEKDCLSDKNAERLKGCNYLIDTNELEPDRLAQAYGLRGYAHLLNHDMNLAIVDFNKSLELVPANQQILLLRGTAYRWNGEYEQAIAALSEAIDADPQTAVAYADRGVAYQANGDVENALKDFEKAIELAPQDPYPYAARAAAFVERDEFELALADYTKAVELKPKDVRTLRDRGDLFMLQGEYNKAIADFSNAIKNYAQDAVSYRSRGLAHAIIGSYASAISDLKKSAEFSPRVRETYHIRGAIYEQLERYELSLADYEKALELYDGDVTALAGRARILGQTGKLDEAMKVAEYVIGLAPDQPAPYLARGLIHSLLKAPQKATADVDMALALGFDDASSRIDSAAILSSIDEHVGALALLNSVLQSGTKNLQALEQRARAYLASGDKVHALEDSNTVLSSRPSVTAYMVRGQLNIIDGNSYSAIRDFANILKLNKAHAGANAELYTILASANATLTSNPATAEALISRGWVHLTLNKKQKALEDFSNAFKLTPQDATISFGAAMLFEQAGKSDVATKLYDDAIKYKPDFADALYKRGMFFAGRGQYDKGVLDIAESAWIDPEQVRQVSFFDTIVLMIGMTIPRQPKNVRLVAARGLIHMLGGDLQKAIDDLDLAHQRDPKDALVLLWRGRVHAKNGDHDRAIEDLEKANELSPENSKIQREFEQIKMSPG